MKNTEKQNQAVQNLNLAIQRLVQEGLQPFQIAAAINQACKDLDLPGGTTIAVTVTYK